MDSKHLVQQKAYSALEARARCTPLQLDSSPFFYKNGANDWPPESAISTPSSLSALSPATPLVTRAASCSSDQSDTNDDRESAAASRPETYTSSAGAKDAKEKRKRSRVTPDQLAHLERFFAADRSPTAARRREISQLLGMQERQTQIWFQNRRAKAKLQDGRPKTRSSSAEPPPATPPELSTGFEVDLHQLIHEDEPVTIIPCTNLAIGTWQRITTPNGKHDLIAYLCDSKRCLTWFIHSGGYGFKMELPFETIIETKFANAAPGSGMATFILSQPPTFYLENELPAGPDGVVTRFWKRCGDWTQGQQATTVLRHILIGSAVQLAHLLRSLECSTVGGEIPLHSPSYRAAPPSPNTDPSPTPLSKFSTSEYSFTDDPVTARFNEQESQRRKSYSGPVTLSYPHSTRDYHAAESGTSVSDTGLPSDLSNNASQPTTRFDTNVYRDYPKSSPVAGSLSHHLPLPAGGSAYSHSIGRTFYDESHVGPSIGIRRHASTTALRYERGISSSNLTTPFHPPPQMPCLSPSDNLSASSTPAISGLPAILYEYEVPMPDPNQPPENSL